MKENVVYNKAVDFSVRIVNLYKYLVENRSEKIMSRQLLRSGTSIGANISESVSAESVSDFIHKLAISQKEAEETLYWLLLLYRTDFITEVQYNSMYDDCIEIKKLLSSISITMKQQQNS